MYIPDWSIVRRVQQIDPRLTIRWMPHKERWGIYRRTLSESRTYHQDILVRVVKNEDGSYRPLDSRVLDDLRRADMHHRSWARHVAQMEAEQTRSEERRLADLQDDAEAISGEIYPQVRREAEEQVGAVNVPREDVHAELRKNLRPETQEVLGI